MQSSGNSTNLFFVKKINKNKIKLIISLIVSYIRKYVNNFESKGMVI